MSNKFVSRCDIRASTGMRYREEVNFFLGFSL
jgi:hypothetical protein